MTITLLDKNECDNENGGCAQNCTNFEGSYDCSCYEGYSSDDGGYSCDGKLLLARDIVEHSIFALFPLSQTLMNVI